MNAAPTPPRRILIGTASYADARGALRLARQLAARSQLVFGGLFVEDMMLNELPRLGRQCVVTARGTLCKLPSARQIHQQIESDAKAFQMALCDISAADVAVERSQGELTLSVWNAANQWDILVLGQRKTHDLSGRVVLITPPAGADSGAANLARDLAQAIGTTTITLGLEPGTGVAEHFPSEAALLARIGRLNCAAVVLDRAAGPLNTLDDLRALISAAHCPVVLIGKSPG